jgi:hypothetical protein
MFEVRRCSAAAVVIGVDPHKLSATVEVLKSVPADARAWNWP